MALSASQSTTLKSFVQASVDPVIVTARQQGNTFDLAKALNADASPVVLGWRVAVTPVEADDAPDYSTFDSIPAGKRESWGFFLAFSRDYSRNKTRKWVTDVWGNAAAASNAEAILQTAVENASVAENAIGGTLRTTGTVSAIARNFVGDVTQTECQQILAP